ncbi:hypothetical protein [Nostoc sp. MG11]|uniref:hypothetical protein n=1 Tax=Nostoc sp. MG11 TaxID=2721166 RepID=UPI0018668939|nr:hypothetical protein [Nostoc sp. MG11]
MYINGQVAESNEINFLVDLSTEEQQSICGGFFGTNGSNVNDILEPDFTVRGTLTTSDGESFPVDIFTFVP